jgi:predicted DNA-binding transcriptional regulator AlpA
MDDELLTVPQVLTALGSVSKRTFYRWREIGRAPRCIRLPNGELRVYRRDLRIWLEQHREQAGV